MTTTLCQGYCGGYHLVSELRPVGRDGEKFCSECRERWQCR